MCPELAYYLIKRKAVLLETVLFRQPHLALFCCSPDGFRKRFFDEIKIFFGWLAPLSNFCDKRSN